MTDERLREIARGNVERHIEVEEDATPDAIYEEAYTLAFDALYDIQCDPPTAQRIAKEVAQCFAQP